MYHDCPPQTYEVGVVVATAVDILTSVAEYHSSILRDYILSETQDEVCVLFGAQDACMEGGRI